MERTSGLEVSKTCDRTSQTRVGLQKGFIDYLTKPFFTAMADMYPCLKTSVEQMQYNRCEGCQCRIFMCTSFAFSRQCLLTQMQHNRCEGCQCHIFMCTSLACSRQHIRCVVFSLFHHFHMSFSCSSSCRSIALCLLCVHLAAIFIPYIF